MSTYKVSDIVKAVRITMDENKESESLISDGDVDTLLLDEIIESKIGQAIRIVLASAPLGMLSDCGTQLPDVDTEDIVWRDGTMYVGWLKLPSDFLRLVIFEMDDWERPVFEAITPESPIYNQMYSRYKGIRGTPQRPIVAIVNRLFTNNDGNTSACRVLEFYTCKSQGAAVEQALYIAKPSVSDDEDGDDSYDIPEQCYDSVIYQIAALTYYTLNENTKAQTMAELSTLLLTSNQS